MYICIIGISVSHGSAHGIVYQQACKQPAISVYLPLVIMEVGDAGGVWQQGWSCDHLAGSAAAVCSGLGVARRNEANT